MLKSFIVGIIISTIVSYIILRNFKKLVFFIRSKLLLSITALVLLLIYTSVQYLYGFENMISTIVSGIIIPINMVIFTYLIVTRKNVRKG